MTDPTVNDREAVLALAWSQRGVHESPPFSNRVLYSRWWGFPGPWCAMFVSWCFYETLGYSPFPATTSRGFAHCGTGAEWFRRNGRWASRRTRPERGWLVFYDFGGWPNRGHVGIVIDVLPDGRLHTIEGNTNGGGSRDGGSVMEHYRSTRTVVGYGVLNYAAVTPPPEPIPEPEPEPEPIPREEPDMSALVQGDAQEAWYVTDGVTKRWVTDRAEAQFLVASRAVADTRTPEQVAAGAQVTPTVLPQNIADRIPLVVTGKGKPSGYAGEVAK